MATDLPDDWAAGDTGHVAAHDNLATRVNDHDDALATKLDLDGGNLSDSDDVTGLLTALGIGQVKIQTSGISSLGIFLQSATPDDTTADSTDSALWFYPAGT